LFLNVYRSFWISWFNGTLTVGSGAVFDNTLAVWPDVDSLREVTGISVTTGRGVEGEWEFAHAAGK